MKKVSETIVEDKKIHHFSETYSLQSYRNSVEYIQSHIQLLDASLLNTLETLSKKGDKIKLTSALNLDVSVYNKLNYPIKQHLALVKLSQKRNSEFAILQLYNTFTKYLQDITSEMFTKNPMFVIQKAVVDKNGEEKESHHFTYAEIIKLENYENVQEQIIKRVFRSIEELRSTTKLLERILKDTKVNLSNELKNNALTYLEMRHLFVHNRGVADDKYAAKYGGKFEPVIKKNKPLPANIETVNAAIQSINSLCFEIDNQLLSSGFLEGRKVTTALSSTAVNR